LIDEGKSDDDRELGNIFYVYNLISSISLRRKNPNGKL